MVKVKRKREAEAVGFGFRGFHVFTEYVDISVTISYLTELSTV